MKTLRITKLGFFTKLGIFALILLFFSQTSAFGQIWIDGEKVADFLSDIIDNEIRHECTGSADTVDIVGFPPSWQNPIPFLPVYSRLINREGNIGTVNVGTYSRVLNAGLIGIMNADTSDITNGYNGDTGYITMLNFNGGSGYNGEGGTGYIETANINRGTVYNGTHNAGFITTVYVNGGVLENRNNAVGGGSSGDGWVGTAFLNGGEIVNGGRIDNLTYTGGFYDGKYYTTAGVIGSIGTLTLAGKSADNATSWGLTGDWGIVENLQFADDGSGILSITAALTSSADIFFTNTVQPTESVDLTYGSIVIDLTGIVSEGVKFSIFDLFDTADVFGTLATLTIGEQQFSSVGNDWAFTFTDGVWSSANAVPEPATLAIVGIGLAGLGLARRRQRNLDRE